MMILDRKGLEEKFLEIEDKSTIAIAGFNNSVTPLLLMYSLYETYKKYGRPRELFIEIESFPGVPGTGLDVIARDMYENGDSGFISGMLLPYLYRSEYLQKMVYEEFFEAYSFSIGIATSIFREMAAGRPGVMTRIGLGTFHDPRNSGSFLNEKARREKRCRVDILYIDGEEYLFYRAPKPRYSFIRGSYADTIGNITMRREAIYGATLPVAMSAKAMPDQGKVFAQVEAIVKTGTIPPKEVHVPGPIVDYVVISEEGTHPQAATFYYDPRVSGEIIPERLETKRTSGKLDGREIIRRRLSMELNSLIKELGRPIIVNLGTGIPSEIGPILERLGINGSVYTTVESGPWGGIALAGNDFGAAISPFAVIPQADQFSIYEGGIADAASLGFLQVDSEGNVNPSVLDWRIPGPGGFTDISNGISRIYFAGGFTGGKSDITVREGNIVIEREGDVKKFVNRVKEIFFNGKVALMEKKKIKYITERAVFSLTNDGIMLEEIAPGIDIDRDILPMMDFTPIIRDVRTMDKNIFRDSFP
ncbi:MAG: CoA-transferase [Thermoplasmata archaeon]|jgi:acyl CoA:acetate/3-ketoacid CoA transferase